MRLLSAIAQGERLSSRRLGGARAHVVHYGPDRHMPEHAHRRAGITLVLAGEFLDTTGGAPRRLAPLSLVVKPPGARHATFTGPGGARSLVLELPEALFDRLQARGAVPGGPLWRRGGPGAARLLRLYRADGGRAAREVERIVTEIAAGGAAAGAGIDARLRLGARLLGEGLRPSQVARRVGLHPVYFARLFRAQLGCAPTQWRLRARVLRAAGRLGSGRGALASIALESGFADQAHFCRVFKRHTGVTPSGFRRLAAGAAA